MSEGESEAPTGLAASASGPPTPQSHGRGSRASRQSDRSCVTCHRRKVRCDKRLPCAACARGGRECRYEDVTEKPRRRRPRQTTIADVVSRVSDLERSIVGASTPSSTQRVPVRRGSSMRRVPDAAQGTPLTAYGPTTVDTESTNEVLVQNGPTSQYVDESVISRMIEAVRETPPYNLRQIKHASDYLQGS
jgi:hypothetical protein